jgi:altronate hydrolase
MSPILQVHPSDDALVALRDLEAGASVTLNGQSWTLREKIPAKQKFAAHDFGVGDLVTMYGVTVGKAKQPIAAGALIHTHNVVHATSSFSGKQRDYTWTPPDVSKWQNRTFNGFKRDHGPAGTANHWIVIPLVFCENRNLAFMREALTRSLGYGKTSPYEQFAHRLVQMQRVGASRAQIEAAMLEAESSAATARVFKNIDGVKFLEHGLGCGGTRQDAQALCRLLAGYINSSNVAGATVLSLGCQHAQVSLLEQELAAFYPQMN